jgi:hypothetical protein
MEASIDSSRREWIMAEQSLRERLHATHTLADHGKSRGKLIAGAALGAVAAVALGTAVGTLWAAPGVIMAGACIWGMLPR